MSVQEQLDADLKAALKSRDELRVSVIRMIKASLKNKAIEKMADLNPDDVVSVLSSLSKQRRESIEQYSAVGRHDLAERETIELQILTAYLPRQLSPEEIDHLVRESLAECGAASPNDAGKVMKCLMPKLRGRADGRAVNLRVRELLAGQI